MKVTKEIEKLENSAVKLTITINKKDVAAGYDETLTKYSKNLQLPGFRKGKVPVSVLERKYGDALKNDVAGELIEKALEEVFGEFDKEKSENRPLAYSQPQLDSLPQLDVTKDLVFSVIYDVMPTVKIEDFSGIKI